MAEHADAVRTPDRIWHDVFLPDDVGYVRAQARTAVAEHLAPVARAIGQQEETAEAFPWSAFRGLADAGCFAIPFQQPFGPGLDHPMLATCIVAEELAYESSSMVAYPTVSASSMRAR